MTYKKLNKLPNPRVVNPVKDSYDVIFPANIIDNKKIIIGDFTYVADRNFSHNIIGHYNHYNDKLIIGKFCQIGKNVKFYMNGVNHQIDSLSTYPFFIMEGWETNKPKIECFKNKGDTIIGNDVWIGDNVTIMPGVKIGNGVIIGTNSTVTKSLPDYTICAGNPIKIIKKRFDIETINLLNKLKWWDLPIATIKKYILMLTSINKKQYKNWLKKITLNKI